ncbi:MAG: SDR family NAD(P)-dependent oxidoreductase [Deltaproteobacteria bacterium]|nr:SDR family NAD(P)-dependent oxidoreductase [Deltaproteobacteria bacterium]MBW2448599.1 SDR family NAD(P)-dependent oxidoreductase [Deltaproteobacteria bacterium]
MGSLEGKVAVVTGAAHGLGRLHALGLAAEGARVVVNDLGVAADGSGRDDSAAQAVVDEIKSAGGEAIAHSGDVADFADAEGMIQAAIETYGDLNILVNNAGFTRDGTIFNLTEDEFDSVMRVHVKGHFAPSKFAMTYWRQKSKNDGSPVYGRLISTASESYLFAPPGQPNYSAAKAGIVSLTMGLAQLGVRYGVTANVVLPRARTRMTTTGPTAAIFQKPEEGFDNFAPENASPLFVYLCTPQAERVSGYVFVVWGQQVKVVDRPNPNGAMFQTDASWNLETLHAELGPHFEKLEPVVDGYTVPAA